jgi:diguanylate cyclase (GGDEF)-like protein
MTVRASGRQENHVMDKKKFLRPRNASVPRQDEPGPISGSPDDASAPADEFSPALEKAYRERPGGARVAAIRAVYAVLLVVFTLGLLLGDLRQPEWFWLAGAVTAGWTALILATLETRRGFLLQQRFQQLAKSDGLTGALNRGAFDEHLRGVWGQAARQNKAVGLALLDLDHFKLLNDQHGHTAGDAVLRAAADILKSYAQRPLDAVGRFGGDEFVVIWYDIDLDSFSALVKLLPAKLWMGLAATKVGNSDITVSGGAVMAWPSPELTIERAIRMADEELYKVKRSCRGTIGLAITTPNLSQHDLFSELRRSA